MLRVINVMALIRPGAFRQHGWKVWYGQHNEIHCHRVEGPAIIYVNGGVYWGQCEQ